MTTFTNSVSGFSRLRATGRIEVPGKPVVAIVYRMGDCTRDLYDEKPFGLPVALWQDSTDAPILLDKKDLR